MVQTLVARNNLSRNEPPTSPTVVSARPYMGDESTNLAPLPVKVLITFRSGAVSSVSNTCQVPRPIAGSASPVRGIFRVTSFGAAAMALRRTSGLAAARRRNSRLLMPREVSTPRQEKNQHQPHRGDRNRAKRRATNGDELHQAL